MLKDFQAEQNFYNKPFCFSYSGLNKLLYSPRAFYTHYILNQKEDRTDQHLIDGSLLHCLLLEEDKFDEKFILSPLALPGESTKKVIDKVFIRSYIGGNLTLPLSELSFDILEVLKEINLHQALKTDQQRIDKILNEESSSYYDFLLNKGNKSVIDTETLERIKLSVEEVRSNKSISDLLGIGSPNSFSEVLVQIDPGNLIGPLPYTFGIRGAVDNIRIDHDNRIIYINDLKTSGKLLQDFNETVDYYKYWLQAAIYVQLVQAKYPELIGYKINFHFIVIDKMMQCYAFPVSNDTLSKWIMQMWDVLEAAHYHYTSKEYDLPYNFKKGVITL